MPSFTRQSPGWLGSLTQPSRSRPLKRGTNPSPDCGGWVAATGVPTLFGGEDGCDLPGVSPTFFAFSLPLAGGTTSPSNAATILLSAIDTSRILVSRGLIENLLVTVSSPS